MASQKYAWVIGIMCFVSGISTMGSMTMFAYGMTSMAADFGITIADMAIVNSMVTLSCNGCAFLAGVICQKIGPRWTMGGGMLGNAVALLCTGLFANDLISTVIISMIGGFFAAALVGSVLPRLVSNWFAPNMRAKAMMLYTLGPTVAGVAFGIIVPIILTAGGWRVLYESMAVVLIVFAVIFMLLVRNSPQDMGTIPLGYSEEEALKLAETAAITDTVGGGSMLVKVLKNKMLWIFGLIYSLWMANFASGNTYGTSTLMSVGIDTTIVGYLNSVTMVVALVSNIVFASLSDKYLCRKFWLALLSVLGGLLGFVTYAILCTPIEELSIPLLFAVSCVSAFTMGTGPIINTINAEVFPPSQRSVGPATVATICIIGSFLGPLISAQFIRMSGDFAPSYMLFSCSIIIIAGILIYLCLPKTGGKYGDPMAEKEIRETLGEGAVAGAEAAPVAEAASE